MKTISLLSLISLAAGVAANNDTSDYNGAWKSGVYNASASLIISGYSVDTDDVKTAANWTLEERLSVSSKPEVLVNLGLRNAAGSLDNVTSGWSVCMQMVTYPRKGASPIDTTCKGFISDDCIKALKASVAVADGQCGTLDFTPCASTTAGFGSHSRLAKNTTLYGGWLSLIGIGPGAGDLIKQYDDRMKEISVVAVGWGHNGTSLNNSISCLAYTDVQPGSRSLKEAFSAAPLPSLSWAVAGLALFMAL